MQRSAASFAPLLLVVVLVSAAACATAGPDAPDDLSETQPSLATAAATGPAFKRCGGDFTPSRAGGWRKWGSRIVSALGSPVHGASDVVMRPGATTAVQAHFGYGGVLDKDLEDEWVWIFVHDCVKSWRYVGYATTDSDGRVTFNMTAGMTPGQYELRLEVVGDATWMPMTLWVLPAGTHLSVFDIDGTLTTSDTELWGQILLGNTPDAYPSAAALTRTEAARGDILVYMTGRPQFLIGVTRAWLDQLGFADGIVKLAPSAGDVLPTNSGVGDYKLRTLRALTAAGLKLDEAFGNASTDIYAYAGAGIPTTRTWIIGSNAGSGGTKPVTGTWAAVVAQLLGEPPVIQPFPF